jgi:hypothetical protein
MITDDDVTQIIKLDAIVGILSSAIAKAVG